MPDHFPGKSRRLSKGWAATKDNKVPDRACSLHTAVGRSEDYHFPEPQGDFVSYVPSWGKNFIIKALPVNMKEGHGGSC